VSVDIATFHPKLQFIVQDQSSQDAIFNARVPSDLRSRISFQTHDFFAPQPVKEANVYLFSSVLHDWSDEMAVKILRQLLPAMKPNSRILVIEGVMGEFGDVSNAQMRGTRSADLTMLALLNGKERTKEDWITLVESADLTMLALLNGKERTKEDWITLVESADERLMVKNIVRPSVGARNR